MARVHPDSSRVTIEDILEETGWGLYYRVLIGVTSACAFCQAAALLSVMFALPLGTCDKFINEVTILTMNMFFFCGRAIGGLFLNACSDVCGRLWFISNSLMIMFCSNFLAAFSHSSASLSVAMFLLGSGLEANTRASRIHLAEILPKQRRGFYFTIPSFFWTVGYIVMIGCAWKLSHDVVDHKGPEMRLTAWRLIFAVSGGLNIIVACATAVVQPSPRYHLFKKQFDLAQSSLKLFYAINKSKYCETWPHSDQDLADIIPDYQLNNDVMPSNCTDQICLLFRRITRTIYLLFKRRFIANTLTLMMMKLLLCSGIIPVHILATKMLMSRESKCEVKGHDILHLLPPLGRSCIFEAKDMILFLYFMILALNILIGQVMVSFWVDTISRRLTTIIGLCMSFTTALVLASWNTQVFGWIENGIYVKATLCSILIIGYSIVSHTLDLIETESFPTAARGTAAGIINFYPNFMLCIIGIMWSTSCQITVMALGFILASSIAVAYCIPDIRGRPMVE